jgi:hypothetical protein
VLTQLSKNLRSPPPRAFLNLLRVHVRKEYLHRGFTPKVVICIFNFTEPLFYSCACGKRASWEPFRYITNSSTNSARNIIRSQFKRNHNSNFFFNNVHGSVHRNNILIYIQQDATLHSLFYLEAALHVSGGTTTHHQERIQLYLQHLVFVTQLLIPAGIAAGISNCVRNTRCCKYSCLRSWWWMVVQQFPGKVNCVTLHLVEYILEYQNTIQTLRVILGNFWVDKTGLC